MLAPGDDHARRDVHQARPGDEHAARSVRAARSSSSCARSRTACRRSRSAKVKATIEAELGKPMTRAVLASSTRSRSPRRASRRSTARASSDGREVAVKVLRPGVRRQVERDKAILIGGARADRAPPEVARSTIRSATPGTSSTRSTIRPTSASRPRTTPASARTSPAGRTSRFPEVYDELLRRARADDGVHPRHEGRRAAAADAAISATSSPRPCA